MGGSGADRLSIEAWSSSSCRPLKLGRPKMDASSRCCAAFSTSAAFWSSSKLLLISSASDSAAISSSEAAGKSSVHRFRILKLGFEI